CGTIPIENHLREARLPIDPLDFDPYVEITYPSLRPGHRYQAVLYIEKEGFEPLLKDARIPERFDVAVLSCKGQSVVAAQLTIPKKLRAKLTAEMEKTPASAWDEALYDLVAETLNYAE